MSKKTYNMRKKRPFLFRVAARIMKIFIRKPKLINLSGEQLSQKAIYVMNHCGARGPLVFELHFPIQANAWGAHEMCGNYKQRWNYLYHVFYQQKLHWGKFRSFVVATLFAIISKLCYNAIGLIGTYTDIRFVSSLKNSVAVLNQDLSIVIFPEDSSKGYADKAPAFHKGFISLAKMYYRHAKEDLPVYCVYFSRKKRTFVVDKPRYINAMLADGKSEEEIANIFLESQHRLYDDYVAKK